MPETLAGSRYSIVKELGRGGMGVVYLAEDRQTGVPVAIKELLIAGGPAGEREAHVARFQREAKAAAGLDHPNIVKVYHYFAEADRHFMVMEYLEGTSVHSRLDARELFSPEEVVRIGAQICQALDYAHQHRVVHRDIKPDNVFLLKNGQAKLMDFGVARTTDQVSKLTQTGTTLGTMAYISPEQLSDSRAVDGRADLFSLGAMLYEMLTLRTPFDGGNLGATIMKIMSEEPAPPRQMNPQIPPRLEAVIMRALRKVPDERFPRAGEMGQALTAALTAAPAAPPPPAPGRAAGLPDRPAIPPRPGTGPLASRPAPPPPRPITGAGPIAGFPARPGTGPLQTVRPVTGLRHVMTIGRPGNGPGEFQRPAGVAVDASRNLWVADTENARLQVFEPSGRLFREIKPAGATRPFRYPKGIAFSPSTGKVYVLDEQDFRIFVLDDTGRLTQAWERLKSESGPPALPGRIAISANGQIVVTEPLGKRVVLYTPTQGQAGVLTKGIQAPAAVAFGPKASLYVLDTGLAHVQVFDNKGNPGLRFGTRGSAPGELNVPRDLTVDRGGNVFVADTLNHRIQVFDVTGRVVAVLGTKGRGDGEFLGPEGIAISNDDQLYVADRGNSRVQVFHVERG